MQPGSRRSRSRVSIKIMPRSRPIIDPTALSDPKLITIIPSLSLLWSSKVEHLLLTQVAGIRARYFISLHIML